MSGMSYYFWTFLALGIYRYDTLVLLEEEVEEDAKLGKDSDSKFEKDDAGIEVTPEDLTKIPDYV